MKGIWECMCIDFYLIQILAKLKSASVENFALKVAISAKFRTSIHNFALKNLNKIKAYTYASILITI
jgi:hypothetical protein